MPPAAMNKVLARCAMGLGAILLFKWTLLDPKSTLPPGEIAHSGLLERISYGVSLSGQSLDPRRHSFLQSRLGRRDTIPIEEDESQLLARPAATDDDGNPIYTERERADLFDTHIAQGSRDFWHRFQLPFATNSETLHLDEQVVKGVVDELMAFNGWAAAACSSLTRPFAADRKDDQYHDLTDSGQLYYFALVVHSADHFLIDQVATIIQLSKRLGPSNIFVSLLDYASVDSTPFLCDMAEMVFTLLGISFRIKRIPPMTKDPAAAYYPLEEAYTRNLALEPLMELYHRRHVQFAKVIWLKGFTCPNDILETLRVAHLNTAAMTCSMDWKEHNGFFIFNDRWRTRDMDGNLFRGSKSTSPIDEAPPRDSASIKRYAQHLPFQVFCCESGVHIIDPAQSFYQGITYRSSIEHGIFNISAAEDGKAPKWSEGPCMDSAQMHFCRDLWMLSAREGVKAEAKRAHEKERKGLVRGLSDEMERIVRAIAPQYAPSDRTSGGYFGFGRKKPVADVKSAEPDDWDEEEEEDGDDEGVAPAEKEEAGKIVEPPKKELSEAEKEEQKEQGMAADAAAAALPVEEQHPPEGVDAGAAGKPDDGAPKADAGAAAKAEEQFVDPEAMLALEAENLAAEANAAGGDAGNARKRQRRDGQQANFNERADGPAAADPAVQNQKDEGAVKRPPSVNNPDESDHLDSQAPPPMKPGSQAATRNKALRNSAFQAARIIMNPRCVTTYAGVSHTQLALDLFGNDDDEESLLAVKGALDDDPDYLGGTSPVRSQSFSDKYALRDFGSAAETFVCQEMRTSGGRSAPKQQRRTGFSIARGLVEGWQPRR